MATIHKELPKLIPSILGASEETTSGVKRLRAMRDEGVLKFPVIAVNDALSKYLFDNRYGTGQSVWDGFIVPAQGRERLGQAGGLDDVGGGGGCF